MNLLKQSVLFTLVTLFMATSVFAENSNQKQVSPIKATSEYAKSLIDTESIYNAKKEANYKAQGEQPAPIVSVVHPEYVPGLRTTDVTIVCDGGSWQSEVSWEILDSNGGSIASGGAPFDGAASLDDGVYTANGWDAYGDGWNGNALVVADANTGTEYLNFTLTSGAEGTATFEISSSAVYGCTDPYALNYNQNCAGEDVEATADDGCCEYPTPPNDDCADAEPVTGPYPVQVTGSTENAQVDCPALLAWNAVWYDIAIPTGGSSLTINVQAEAPITNAGIVVMDDCNCDDYIPATYNFDGAIGWIQLYVELDETVSANGSILYPLYIVPQQGFTVTFDLTEWVWGCTDPNATNYNPDATNDDGSCEYAPCEDHDLLMYMHDSYGDGWNGNEYVINNLETGDLVAQGTLETGSEGVSAPICLEDGNYSMWVDGGSFQGEVSWNLDYADGSGTVLAGGCPYDGLFSVGETDDILGCTDSTAINYNPDATIDDGSCVYNYGESCEYSLDYGTVNGGPVSGATTEGGDFDWYMFTVDSDYDWVSATLCGSDFDTKIDIWSACGGELLATNDDSDCGEGFTLQSTAIIGDIAAGTYYAMVYGFGTSFGNYALDITGWLNATVPVLSAEGMPGGINLAWETIPMAQMSSGLSNEFIITDISGNNPAKGEEPEVRHAPGFYNVGTVIVDNGNGLRDTDFNIYMQDAYGDGWNGNVLMIGDNSFTIETGDYAEATLTLADGTYSVTCDGGSWQSEVSWQIVDSASGNEVLAGGAPYSGVLAVGETDDVLGCTDTEALNYGYNCMNEYVGDPDFDDGCCTYPTPPNDNCEDAELVTGPYPVEITGSSENAQIDCEGFLNWNAVWYEIELPYDANTVNIHVQADAPITNGGIIVMDDCACDDFIGAAFTWNGAEGWLDLNWELMGPGTILYPLFIDPQGGYTLTVNVTELYVPTYNVYRTGEQIADGIMGESYFDAVDAGAEYCYTVTQMLPDNGGESGHSNEACASAMEGIPGDTMDDPFVINNLPFTEFGTTAGFYDNYDEACPYTGSLSADVVYSYSATSDMDVTVDLCGEGSYYDTKLYVYENDVSMLAGCNDDACNNSHTSFLSSLSVSMTAGNTYYIVVDGYGSQEGDYEIVIGSAGMCFDDQFEDDDTKDQATDHAGNGTWDYALCADDNPDGLVQPGGFTAVDWSAVTMGPWTSLTASTVGDPVGANDLDLFVEDYDGDGICQWGGGDDLAGSGTAYSEELAVYSNLSDNSVTVYVGIIYFAGDNPILYALSLEVVGLDCPECPQNLTATSGLESIDLNWAPPYVQPGGRAGDESTEVDREFARDVPHKKSFLQTKDELKVSGLHPYAHGNPDLVEAYNNELKFQKMQASGRSSVASSHKELQEMLDNEPYVPGSRDATLFIQMWDSYGDSWNGNVLTIGDATFTIDGVNDDGAYAEATLTLADGTYPVTCGGGSWMGEVSWMISDADSGAELLSGGAPFEGELVIGGEPPPECEDTDVTIACDGGSWQSEVSWQITDSDGNEIASGGAPFAGDACLASGDYNVYGQDSYGDGWTGNFLTVTDDADGTEYLNWTVEGSSGETTFTIGGAGDVYGCMDPDAANYDPDATIDDGSCVYWGDVCEYPLEAVEGSNDASGDNQFFHYSVATDGSVTISSQNETEDAVWDTYLYVLGSCATDEYGNYNDLIIYNDDCCGYYGPSTVEFNVTAGQDLYLYWYGVYGPGPFPFTIEEGDAGEECVDDEFEDNDTSTSSAPIEPGTYDLVHCSVDPDWFQITVNNGQSLHLVVTEGEQEPSGMMDVGIWVFEIDPSYTQVYSPNLTAHDVSWSNDSDHPMIANFAIGDFWAGGFEGTYTMMVELVDFEQTTYTVYRDEVSIASDLLLTEYSDMSIDDNVEYCYTVTANAGGVESAPSNEACETHVYIEPPDAPSNVTAVGGWLDVGGVDYPAVTWSWDYELPPPGGTNVTVDILTDNYPGETTWEIIDDAGNVMDSDGPYSDPATQYVTTVELDDGDYTFIIYDAFGDGICCAYGEGSYSVYLDDGTVLASGGEFPDVESTPFTIGGGRDESPSVFNINDGSSESVPGFRDIIFELCFEYYGTDYCFQTVELSITIYGFADGDLICGWAYAIENGTYSDASETACANAGGTGTVDVTVDHATGWNMVSLAVGTDANGVGDLFSGFIEGTLYEYPYMAVDALNLGQGYWLRFDSDGTDTQTGEPVDDLGISLSTGWNLIGSVSDDAGIGDPDGIVISGTLYGYPYSDEVTAIEPGSGYWLRASADGMVYLSTTGSIPRTTAELTANSMTINGMKLHFGVDVTEDLALSHSLPPRPFEGAFDVRFAGDTKIAQDAAVIDVMNPSDELTIEYTIVKDAGDHMLWVLATENDEFVLDGMGSITLPGSVTGLTLNKVPEVPETFGLSQNFPNPFNPVTNISFQVPEASDITVSVYNMMGQKIADLVQAHVPAGYHQVVWDSRNLQGEPVSSGVYLYTITSGDFHAMKKMILMK